MMIDLSQIHEHAEVIGADGVHVGVVDHVQEGRLKLTKTDSSDGRHHFIDAGLIAGVEDGVVRLSAIGAVAVTLEDPDDGSDAESHRLDEGLEETFPASDPVSAKHIT
jgi:hypothetical protein